MSNPNILWAQDRKNLFLTLEIVNLASQECKVEDKKIIFQGKSAEQDYNLEIELLSSVDIEKYTVNVTTAHVKILLEKTSRQFWNRLTKTKQNNVKIDWLKWVHDEESSEDSDENDDLIQNFNDFKKTLPSELLEKDFQELLPGQEVNDYDYELDLEKDVDEDEEETTNKESFALGSKQDLQSNRVNNDSVVESIGNNTTEDLKLENGENSVESLDSGFLANGEESIIEEGEKLELIDTDGQMDVDELDMSKLDADLESDLGI